MASSFSVDGLISGINTTSMIDQLMALESQPLTALQQQQTTIQQKAAAFTDLQSKVSTLQLAVQNLTLSSYVNSKSAVTDTPATSLPILTSTADATAANGSFSVTVSRLATATRMASGSAIGRAIDPSAVLSAAGFSLTPTTGTFTIKGTSLATITIDSNTVLSDGVDAPGSNTIVAKINNSGIGVTASIANDADGRPNLLKLVSDPGVKLQIGAASDTSNFLSAAKLLDAQVIGNSAATTTGTAVAAGTIASTAITINGVTTTTRTTDAGNTAAQNAASIAADINATPNSTVLAVGNDDGTISLTQRSSGASYKINIADAGSGSGLSAGETANGTDSITSLVRMGGTKTSETLTNSRLVTPIAGLDGSGNGEFKINGVSITYNQSDTINNIIGRINASSAGVIASYDALTDRMKLTSTTTGERIVTLEDTTGNFLQATGILDAEQTIGQNALYSVDSVANGQQLSSASNTVTGIIPGVTLTLKSTSTTPVEVTIGQDTDKTVSAVKDFVAKFNDVISTIKDQTKYSSDTKEAGLLLGDPSVTLIDATLRTLVAGAAIGASGKYRTFADIGISTGKVGSAVGSDYTLQLDETKLANALIDNPSAVAGLFNAFTNSASLSGTTGSIASITGSPTANHEAGYYKVTTTADVKDNITIQFFRSDGAASQSITGTIAAGGTNSTLIPGVTLTMKPILEAGEQTINVGLQTKGLSITLNDYLKQLAAPDGLFASQQASSEQQVKDLSDQINDMQTRLDAKRETLKAKYATMEATLAQLQVQSNALASQLAGLSASNIYSTSSTSSTSSS
ncbi:MAG: flagellar filament capping protein FliD [Chloroflexi bacterium]|nr:flagellar filament capping protein FliD [Chloroflexota bacterium]